MEFSENIREEKATIPNERQNQKEVQNQPPESQTHPKPHKLCTTTQSGWSMISRSSDDYDDEEEVFVDPKELVKLRSWFERLHRAVNGSSAAALGPDGVAADLFKLFVIVRGKGGGDAVTERGFWTSVAGELGLGLEFSAAVKLVYAKHLEAFERWVDRGVDVVRELCLMDNGADGFGNVMSRKRKSAEESELDGPVFSGALDWLRRVARDPCETLGSLPDPSKWKDEPGSNSGLLWNKLLMAREALFLKRNNDEQQKNQRMHPGMYTDKAGLAYNLRERQTSRRKLFNGKSGGEAGLDSSSDADRSGSGSDDQNELEASIYRHSPSRIPTGPAYQAQVPEWTLDASECDLKWLGTRVWPLHKVEHKYLVERDPIGKGRQEDSCGCQDQGSLVCVRFHIAEKRLRVKRELASAFYLWRFNKMGDEVKMFWTKEEQNKFSDTIASNLSCLGESFWQKIFEAFPLKSRADLVSYYYNVYILERRAHQNRFTPNNIDSDDEEFEPELETDGDIVGKETPESKKNFTLSTPNKQHRK